jgi:hypothetical protein
VQEGLWPNPYPNWHLASSNTGYCFLAMFLWYPVMDLARAPRHTTRKKGSGYKNGLSQALEVTVM